MCSADAILAAREERNNYVLKLAQTSDVITAKANVPGSDKRVKESFLTVRYFANILKEAFTVNPVIFDGADGMCAVLSVCGEGLKLKTTAIEENCPIGRYADLDVYPQGGTHSLSRGHMRKCYLCDNAAFVCARQGNHTTLELLNALKKGVREYFSAHLYAVIEQSLMAELNLEDKFGLVTPTSQGSHGDMNFEIMLKSQRAIIPYLVQSFWVGFDSDSADGLLEKLRPIGLEAEEAMFKSVGINTYKGFIFVAGILLASAGHLLSKGVGEYGQIFATAKGICNGISRELEGEGNSFGMQAFRIYGFLGVRGLAEGGFVSVRKAEEIIDNNLSKESLLKALAFIVGDIEDTVLLKRSGTLENYLYFKNAISSIDVNDETQLKLLNAQCIESGISIGGSADVLAAAILIKKLKTLWYFDK